MSDDVDSKATIRLDLLPVDGITATYNKPHNGTGVVEIKTSEPPQGWPQEIAVKFPKNLGVHGLNTRLVHGSCISSRTCPARIPVAW